MVNVADNKQSELVQLLNSIEQALKTAKLWQSSPPEASKLSSCEPFCIDTLAAHEWLQWIFMPRIYALLEAGAPLPNQFSMVAYFEEALKEEKHATLVITRLKQLETLLNTL